MPPARHLRFEITGDLALASLFLMAHWPNPETTPELEISHGPMAIIVDTRGNAVSDLKKALEKMCALDESLIPSAAAWLREIERQTSVSKENPAAG